MVWAEREAEGHAAADWHEVCGANIDTNGELSRTAKNL